MDYPSPWQLTTCASLFLAQLFRQPTSQEIENFREATNNQETIEKLSGNY